MHTRPLVIIALCATALLAGLITLLRYVPDFVNGIDARAAALVAPLQTLTGVEIFLGVTALGGVVGVTLVALGFAYLVKLPLEGVFRLALALVGVSVAEKIVKELFLRARPSPLAWLDPVTSYSFPSAHAAASLVLYGFVAVTLYAKARTARGRALALAVPLAVALLIGASRVVLSVHYFTDIVGGFLVGAIVLACALLLPLGFLRLSRYG